MSRASLSMIAASLVADGKGILAADESFSTIEKRFKAINVDSSEEQRRAYRDMLLTTEGLEEFVSGVIFFDETLRQATKAGVNFVDVLRQKGMISGIKVDKGTVDLSGFPGEKITDGLDGLQKRLVEYSELGAQFAKWRAVINVNETLPTRGCIHANAHALARYAALCQSAGLVPIVEPEVMMEGSHTIERCEEVTTKVLKHLFSELAMQRVQLEGTLLKVNMVVSGKDCSKQASIAEVAEATVRVLRRTVPAAIPGVVFLSGGQSAIAATEHLNAINRLGKQPWKLTFSYGRALQDPALQAWKGSENNRIAGQQALYLRAKCNSAASYGEYSSVLEKE